MSEEQTTNWNETLQHDDIFLLAKKVGLSVEDFKADTEDSYKSVVEDIKKKLRDMDISALPAEDKARIEDLKKENTTHDKANDKGTLEVGGEQGEPQPNDDWIKEKREFWKEYAGQVNHKFDNDVAKDESDSSFSCTLSKDNLSGTVKYSSPNNVQISKESHLVIYQGVVKDAMKNDLSITFGTSLDDTQKALLLAACLKEEQTYANGEKVQMINPPKVDVNADYFKKLPEDVQTTLKEYAKMQELTEKLAAVKQRLKDNKNTNGGEMNADERYTTRQEQLKIMKDLVAENPSKAINKDRETVEKIMAARMGIINDPSVKDVQGKPITKNEKYMQYKNEQNPALQTYLKKKYGNEKG